MRYTEVEVDLDYNVTNIRRNAFIFFPRVLEKRYYSHLFLDEGFIIYFKPNEDLNYIHKYIRNCKLLNKAIDEKKKKELEFLNK